MAKSKNVGEMNGLWAFLFRLSMALIPLGIVYAVTIGTWLAKEVIELNKFRTCIETIDPKATEVRVAELELEAARHGWNGDG